MSDGWSEAIKWAARATQAELYAQLDSSSDDRDAIDGLDEFDLSDFLDDPTVPGTPFDKYKDFYEHYRNQQSRNEPKCDCGSEKTYGKGTNIHADWCSVRKK